MQNQTPRTSRIHPLVASAAVAMTAVSLFGIAAIADGKKIAMVAGALLGGYTGNEVAHDRNPLAW